jgi:hypothetical protein
MKRHASRAGGAPASQSASGRPGVSAGAMHCGAAPADCGVGRNTTAAVGASEAGAKATVGDFSVQILEGEIVSQTLQTFKSHSTILT